MTLHPGFSFGLPCPRQGAAEAGNPEMPTGIDKKGPRKADSSSWRSKKEQHSKKEKVLDHKCSTPAKCHTERTAALSPQQSLNGSLDFHLCPATGRHPFISQPKSCQRRPGGEPGLSSPPRVFHTPGKPTALPDPALMRQTPTPARAVSAEAWQGAWASSLGSDKADSAVLPLDSVESEDVCQIWREPNAWLVEVQTGKTTMENDLT